jgi:penicillin-binding protein 1B
MMKRYIFLKIIIMALLAALLIIGAYIYSVVYDVKMKMQLLKITPSEAATRVSVLEEETVIEKDTLEVYWSFTKHKLDFDQWINDQNITKHGLIRLKHETELAPLVNNQCERLNCFQSRMSFDQLPANLWKGLIGIEDYRFLEHEGVDYVSIARAIITDLKEMRLAQGGSTLTQQLAKNLFLSSEKKIERKIRELIYAIYLENVMTKDEILGNYFNEVFWGTIGGVYIKGVQAASIIYFQKKPSELTDYEVAILIGLLKGPGHYSPIKNLKRLKERTSVVYDRLKSLELVSSKKESQWNEEQWDSWEKSLLLKDNNSILRSIYYTSKNDDQLLGDYEKVVLYESVANVMNLVKKDNKLDIAAKIVIIDNQCESVNCVESFTYYSKFERDKLNAIKNEKHQVGSILKPIIYEIFQEYGKSLNDKVSTRPITLKLKSGEWTPKDATTSNFEISLREAIQKSKNIPLVRIASEIGFDKIEVKLVDYVPSLLRPLREYPSQLLGAVELSLAELVEAYLKFIKISCQNIKQGSFKFEETILFELSKAEDTTISKVADKLIKKINVFGKTGTTNAGLDNWYVAFDGKYFYAIWLGVESNRNEKKLNFSGATTAFRIFQKYLQYNGKQIHELNCY